MSAPRVPARLLLISLTPLVLAVPILALAQVQADGHLAGNGPSVHSPALSVVRHVSSNELLAPVSTQPPMAAMAPALGSDAPPPLGSEPSSPPSRLRAVIDLLGSALFGGLLLGSGGGLGGGLLLTLLAALAAVWWLRRTLAAGEVPRQTLRTEPAGWMPAPPPQANPVPPIARSTPNGGALRLPPGFDLPAFLREARLSFVRLQWANDRADIADLREFTTPQMFAALAQEIQERRGVAQNVEVMALDAQLLDLSVEHEDALASVRFHGSAREDEGPPEAFTEVWHVRKRLSDPRAAWLLDGIQQSS